MSIALSLACGAAIGFLLGALGGGGSILAVPALVYLLGQSPQEATTASLEIVAISSAVSAVGFHRHRQVNWRVAMTFVAVGLIASVGGTTVNRHLPDSALLASFAGVVGICAVLMLLKSRDSPPGSRPAPSPTSASDLVNTSGTSARTTHRRARIQVVIAGLLVGFLTGLLGVGGGFIVVPVLVTTLGFTLPVAAGTSLVVIALNSATSLMIHAGTGLHSDWNVVAPFTAATIATAYVGRRTAARYSSTMLARVFALVLLVVGLGIGLEVALTTLS